MTPPVPDYATLNIIGISVGAFVVILAAIAAFWKAIVAPELKAARDSHLAAQVTAETLRETAQINQQTARIQLRLSGEGG